MFRYRVGRFVRSVLTSFWFWPLAFIGFALWLSTAVTRVAQAIPPDTVPTTLALSRGAEAYAGVILSTTAAADITILTFAFSTLMVVLQLASSQLSPRLLRTMVREGSAQVSIAVMAGGFVFSMYSLLNVYAAESPLVPTLLVMIALIWTTVIVLVFLRFVGYTISHIRAPAVIRSVAETTAQGIKRTYPTSGTPAKEAMPRYDIATPIEAPADGIVTGLDMLQIARWARRKDASVSLSVGLGDYVSAGVPIGRVESTRPVRAFEVTHFMFIERERTLRGDPPYGFRLLVDIANKALSPAINDPTTATQVLDELQSLLILLHGRPDREGHVYDEEGVLRLRVPVVGWRTYLNLSVQEIYEYGQHSSQVTQRIERMLSDLAEVVTGDRLAVVEQLRASISVIPPMVTPLPQRAHVTAQADVGA